MAKLKKLWAGATESFRKFKATQQKTQYEKEKERKDNKKEGTSTSSSSKKTMPMKKYMKKQ
eukprot:9738438-Karenia_brevis.AAC.1